MTTLRTHFLVSILFVLMWLPACAYGTGDGVPPSEEQPAAGGGPAQPPVPPAGPPTITGVEVTPSSLTEGESASIIVELEDPDGAGDVLGGRLFDASGAVQLGLFEALPDGRFRYLVSWQQLHALEAIAFEETASRQLRLLFVDNQLNEVTADIAIQLDCGGYPACDGSCGSADDPDHCSGCNESALCCQASMSQVPAETLCSEQASLLDDFQDCACNGPCGSLCGNYCVPENGWVSAGCYNCISSVCAHPIKACFLQEGC